jgi:hypothetical protein
LLSAIGAAQSDSRPRDRRPLFLHHSTAYFDSRFELEIERIELRPETVRGLQARVVRMEDRDALQPGRSTFHQILTFLVADSSRITD